MFERCSRCGITAMQMTAHCLPGTVPEDAQVVHLCPGCNRALFSVVTRFVFGDGEDFSVAQEPAWFKSLGLKG